VETLKIHNSNLDRLDATLVWGSTHTLGTNGKDKLTNRCVNCGDMYFLTLKQSHGGNRMHRFRKYSTFFTLRVGSGSNICKFV